MIMVLVQLQSAWSADLSYQVKLFDDGRARHYQHKLRDGTTVRFFVLKSSDGIIRAALDACDVCWTANKGYQQKGNDMICKNCGKKFLSSRINEVSGGCNPAPLRREVSSGIVVIREKDLKEGARYFTFKGGSR